LKFKSETRALAYNETLTHRRVSARQCFHIVMAGLVPAIHVFAASKKGVDARDNPGHDEQVDAADRIRHTEPAA
jgi:hypothetical protein